MMMAQASDLSPNRRRNNNGPTAPNTSPRLRRRRRGRLNPQPHRERRALVRLEHVRDSVVGVHHAKQPANLNHV